MAKSTVVISERKVVYLTLTAKAYAMSEETNRTPTILSKNTATEAAIYDPINLICPILIPEGQIRDTEISNKVRAKISFCRSHEVLKTGNCKMTNSAKYTP